MAMEGVECHVLRQIQVYALLPLCLVQFGAMNSQCHEVDAAKSTADLLDILYIKKDKDTCLASDI